MGVLITARRGIGKFFEKQNKPGRGGGGAAIIRDLIGRRCFLKYMLLNFFRFSQESTYVGVFFNKVRGLKACKLIKKRF